LITVRLSLHTSISVATTQGTQIKFVSFPSTATATTAGFTTASDQPTSADYSKQAVNIDGHGFPSDDWGHVGESEDNVSDSKDDFPLENVLGDEVNNAFIPACQGGCALHSPHLRAHFPRERHLWSQKHCLLTHPHGPSRHWGTHVHQYSLPVLSNRHWWADLDAVVKPAVVAVAVLGKLTNFICVPWVVATDIEVCKDRRTVINVNTIPC